MTDKAPLLGSRRGLIKASLASVLLSSCASVGENTKAATATLPANTGYIEPDLTIDLWPNGVILPTQKPITEKIIQRAKPGELSNRVIENTQIPRLLAFLAKEPNGAAIMITPGGGYARVVFDHEGGDIAKFYNAKGISVFVLLYRLPGDGWGQGPDVALSDAQRAMRIIKHRAKDFKIDANRVAALGFSAGGHLCADLSTRYDEKTYEPQDMADSQSARPFIAAPIYPVISMESAIAHMGSRNNLIGANPSGDLIKKHSPNENVSKNTPPMFLCHSEDDGAVKIENTMVLRQALKENGIVCETHLFAIGGHGFSIRNSIGKPANIWPELFYNFAKSQKLV